MDQNQFILQNLGIDKMKFGKIYSFVDFGNINRWYDKDTTPFSDGRIIGEGQKIVVGIEKLGSFVELFSQKKLFYYGIDLKRKSSIHIKYLAEKIARFKVVSKQLQMIKHYVVDSDFFDEQRVPFVEDGNGRFIYIPKCNFDVEIAVDAMRFSKYYDTVALFSSDSDFTTLLSQLKSEGKKIILFYSGPTSSHLKNCADLLVNGRQIRELIGFIK